MHLSRALVNILGVLVVKMVFILPIYKELDFPTTFLLYLTNHVE